MTMLVNDIYSLLPAFTLISLLAILLWPENIAYKNRLRLFMVVLLLWVIASVFGMNGYGTTENPTVCFINFGVGLFGLVAVFAAYRTKPLRRDSQDSSR
jgi:cyanate permease